MISVLHIIDTGGPGGAETVFLQCASRLDPTGFTSVPVVGSDDWLAQRVRESGLEPIVAPARGSFNFRYLRRIIAIARDTDADLIVAHLYGSSVYASIAGRIIGIPVVSIFHGASDISPGDRLVAIKARIIRHGSRRVVFVSQQLRDRLQLILGLPESHCAIIANGVDTTRFMPGRDDSIRRQLRIPADALLVGAIGNVRPAKSYDVLLHAARILLDKSDRFHFVIAGDCQGALADQLLSLRQQLALEDRVTFLGLRADVPTVLHNLDVFVLCSSNEGFSIACVEAMACGLPVVATRCGGPEDILDDTSGLLVPVGHSTDLADAIYRLGTERELAVRLGSGALERARREFSLGRMISRHEALYEATVSGDSRGVGACSL